MLPVYLYLYCLGYIEVLPNLETISKSEYQTVSINYRMWLLVLAFLFFFLIQTPLFSERVNQVLLFSLGIWIRFNLPVGSLLFGYWPTRKYIYFFMTNFEPLFCFNRKLIYTLYRFIKIVVLDICSIMENENHYIHFLNACRIEIKPWLLHL